jgi:hypothetical protein
LPGSARVQRVPRWRRRRRRPAEHQWSDRRSHPRVARARVIQTTCRSSDRNGRPTIQCRMRPRPRAGQFRSSARPRDTHRSNDTKNVIRARIPHAFNSAKWEPSPALRSTSDNPAGETPQKQNPPRRGLSRSDADYRRAGKRRHFFAVLLPRARAPQRLEAHAGFGQNRLGAQGPRAVAKSSTWGCRRGAFLALRISSSHKSRKHETSTTSS